MNKIFFKSDNLLVPIDTVDTRTLGDPVDVNTEYARQYIESALRESMNNYIGQPASKVSADTIKNVLEGQLNEMNKQGLFKEKKVPTVKVTINGPYVETRFYDPDTGEEVGLYDLIS
jgi:hypothetical protein